MSICCLRVLLTIRNRTYLYTRRAQYGGSGVDLLFLQPLCFHIEKNEKIDYLPSTRSHVNTLPPDTVHQQCSPHIELHANIRQTSLPQLRPTVKLPASSAIFHHRPRSLLFEPYYTSSSSIRVTTFFRLYNKIIRKVILHTN